MKDRESNEARIPPEVSLGRVLSELDLEIWNEAAVEYPFVSNHESGAALMIKFQPFMRITRATSLAVDEEGGQ